MRSSLIGSWKAGSARRAGATSYLLVTDAAIAALDLDPAALGMVRLTEQYEELGSIRCHLLDLGRRWEDRSSRSAPAAERAPHVPDRAPPARPAGGCGRC